MAAQRFIVPHKPCNICGSHEHVTHRASLIETNQSYDVFFCRRCDLVYTDVVFDVAVDESLTYYSDLSSNLGGTRYLHAGEEFERRFRHQVADILCYQNGQRGRLLDYGCGPGYFLRAAQKAGFKVVGFDIQRGAQVLGQKIGIHNIYVGHPNKVTLPGPFDVVTMYNVIEHLSDPLKTLQQLHDQTVDDALLVVETPNENSLVRRIANLAFRLTGGRWNVLNQFYQLPPHHVFCFSDKSLRLILEKAGFYVTAIQRINPGTEFIKIGANAEGLGMRPWLRARMVEVALLAGQITQAPTRIIAYARKRSSEE